MRADLIQILADHMRGVEEERFKMSAWCGSTTCMGGEACRLLPFMAAGLGFTRNIMGALIPHYIPSGKEDFKALAAVLEISLTDAIDIFSPDQGVPWWTSAPTRGKWTPKIAAEVLESYLRWKLTGAVQP